VQEFPAPRAAASASAFSALSRRFLALRTAVAGSGGAVLAPRAAEAILDAFGVAHPQLAFAVHSDSSRTGRQYGP
jgi:hypothetical protein